MANVRISEWRKLPMSLSELCLDTTLRCGQSFRWKRLDTEEWTCALHGRILFLKQDTTHLHYRASLPKVSQKSTTPDSKTKSSSDDSTEILIRHYFNLKPNLTELYESWSIADANFKRKAPKFTGVRILRQDPWEALVGFVCSSNNNIARICQMVNNLCIHYGPLLGHVDDQAFHDFPAPEDLIGPGVETHLRQLGFGYRAKYLAQTARIVAEEKPPGWLAGLSYDPDMKSNTTDFEILGGGRSGYRKAHEELLYLQGVGPKVADCVCLMGLGWGEAVPVDTHVWQIAQRDYKFGKGKHKSLTKATYDAVGDHFRSLWGREAGWAHSVLFAADLRTFAIRLASKTEADTEDVLSNKEEEDIMKESSTKKRQFAREGIVKEEAKESGLLDVKIRKKPAKGIK